jgi:hypothetical protein
LFNVLNGTSDESDTGAASDELTDQGQSQTRSPTGDGDAQFLEVDSGLHLFGLLSVTQVYKFK